MCQLNPVPVCEMLLSASVEDLKEYKKNALKYLKRNDQFATAKIVENLFDQEIFQREVTEEWNKIFPETGDINENYSISNFIYTSI